MSKWIILLQTLVCSGAMAMPDGTVVKRVSAGKHDALLQPLSTELARPYEAGFVRDSEIYRCDNGADANARRGVMWSIELNQTVATPVAASAWAQAEGTSDAPATPDFSLYLDLMYMDNTPLYGQSASFDTDDNLGDTRQKAVLTLTALSAKSPCHELVSQGDVVWQKKQTTIELDAGDVRVIAL